MCKLCVFAGTGDGRRMVEELRERGAGVTACVATEYGETLLGMREDVHCGRMDEAEMVSFFREHDFNVVIDATHPYADKVTENIAGACALADVPYIRMQREGSAAQEDGVYVENATECAEYLAGTEGDILLTTGSKDLPVYAEKLSGRIFARVLPMKASLDICESCGIEPARIIAMQGPFTEEMNIAMLRMTGAKYMVTKDGGNVGGYTAKIRAAQTAGVIPVIIGRPAQRDGSSYADTLRILEEMYGLPKAKKPRKKVYLAGIGMGGNDTRTLGCERAVREAQCLIGAERMLKLFNTSGKSTYEAVAAEKIMEIIHAGNERVFTVLLSGDTGFYSGAKRLAVELTDVDVEILPGIGSLVYFCSRLGMPWENVRAVSLHGRECNFVGEVREHEKVFALLGGVDGVNAALKRLAENGFSELHVAIGSKLGYPDEKIIQGNVSELIGKSFDKLSVMMVINPVASKFVVTPGIEDDAFDRDEVPMTKSEVRAVVLSKLQLTRDAVVYDVGSGSGSVTVECAMRAVNGHVFGIEVKDTAVELTKRNAEKFGCENLTVISGTAPDALKDLPAPTHVFIGGSRGKLRPIIDLILDKSPECRIVVTSVTMETTAELTGIVKDFEYSEIVNVAVTRTRGAGRFQLFAAQNPVYVFTLQHRKTDVEE